MYIKHIYQLSTLINYGESRKATVFPPFSSPFCASRRRWKRLRVLNTSRQPRHHSSWVWTLVVDPCAHGEGTGGRWVPKGKMDGMSMDQVWSSYLIWRSYFLNEFGGMDIPCSSNFAEQAPIHRRPDILNSRVRDPMEPMASMCLGGHQQWGKVLPTSQKMAQHRMMDDGGLEIIIVHYKL